MSAEAPPRVQLTGITKWFDEVHANDGVDLSIRSGEIHALLGENGAGKSTLMNILSGLLLPDEGVIWRDGQPVSFSSPKDATQSGIGMIHQHYQLFEALTVAENVHAGWEDTPRRLPKGSLEQRTRELSERLDLSVDPGAFIWQLSLGEKQSVEILRTLARGAEVLILDEPTASLTPSETKALFELLYAVRDEGRSALFISHKLPEVLAIADRISVMRQGKMIETLLRKDADPKSLARLMVGKEVPRIKRRSSELGAVIVKLDRASAVDDRGLPALHDVNLEVRAGEIVGVAGVAGNGQRELAEVVAGQRRLTDGRLTIDGREYTRPDARAVIDAGVGYIPEDRFGTGLAGSEPIWRNAILKRYRRDPISRLGSVRRAPARAYASELVESVSLSTSDLERPANTLSGGNAQRVLAGREIEAASTALVLANPTHGLDVQAAEKVKSAILDAQAGKIATLLISEDLDDVLEIANRVVVLYGGRIAGEFDSKDADREEIGALMSGLGDAKEEPGDAP